MVTRYAGLKSIILVTGDRWWSDQEALYKVLSREDPRTVVIHGDAAGADSMADLAALRNGMPRCINPYFGCFGRAGGPIRNSFMLQVILGLKMQGWRVRVFAFHDDLKASKGTKDMVTRARKEGLEVKIFGHKKQARSDPRAKA